MVDTSTTELENTPFAKRIRRLAQVAMVFSVCFSVISAIFGRVLYQQFVAIFWLLPIVGSAAVIALCVSLVVSYRQSHPDRSPLGLDRTLRLLVLTAFTVTACVAIAESIIVHQTERIHFFKYGLLCVFVYFSQTEINLKKRLFAAFLLAAAVGTCEECIQFFVPGRVSELRDVGLNVVGAAFGVVFIWLILRWQGREVG